MKSSLQFMYGAVCICMAMYICWNLGAMTAQTQFWIFCQQYMRESNDTMPYRSGNILSHKGINQSMSQPKERHTPPAKVDNKTSTQEQEDPGLPFPPTIVDGEDINPAISKFFSMKTNERKDAFINLHRYEFGLSSEICSTGKVFLIMIVNSSPQNFKNRRLLRTTFGSVRMYRGKKLGVVFLLGAVYRKSLQDSVNRESKQHHDIVQGNFPDSYISLTRKHIMAMHWYIHHCKADFTLKLDDDTFVNPYRIVDYILKVRPNGKTIYCKIRTGNSPARSQHSKWHTPVSQYPFSMLPPFCLGFAYLTTTWKAMYKASETNRLMNMDDLYVSVVLAMKAQVRKVDLSEIMYSCPRDASPSLELLNRKAVFLDTRNRCGKKPFIHWQIIMDLNTDT